MPERHVEYVEPDCAIVHCPEADYLVTQSAVARFETLGEDERREAQEKAKSFARPGERPCIDTRCF